MNFILQPEDWSLTTFLINRVTQQEWTFQILYNWWGENFTMDQLTKSSVADYSILHILKCRPQNFSYHLGLMLGWKNPKFYQQMINTQSSIFLFNFSPFRDCYFLLYYEINLAWIVFPNCIPITKGAYVGSSQLNLIHSYCFLMRGEATFYLKLTWC